MTFLVTIDGAGGEVKDLEHHIGSLHWQPPVILREICSPMMPPGAHITDRSRISPVLPRPLSGRLLSSQALANGEGRGADSFVGNCRLMRRGVSPATPLRTGFIQRMLFRTAFGTDLLGEETPCQGYIQFLRFQFHPMREPSCQGEEIKNAAAVRKPLHFYF